MPKLSCPIQDCEYETETEDVAGAAAQLAIHGLIHTAGRPVSRSRPPAMERPVISRGSTAEEWQIFLRKWDDFKKGTEMPDDLIKSHLWQCCEITLSNDLFKQVGDFNQVSEGDLLDVLLGKGIEDVHHTLLLGVALHGEQSIGEIIGHMIRFVEDMTNSARIMWLILAPIAVIEVLRALLDFRMAPRHWALIFSLILTLVAYTDVGVFSNHLIENEPISFSKN